MVCQGGFALTSSRYVDRSIAQSENLISYGNGAPAIMRADSSANLTVGQTQGRASVRIESKKTFTHGLIIADIAHMPGDDCGVWPACEFPRSIVMSMPDKRTNTNL